MIVDTKRVLVEELTYSARAVPLGYWLMARGCLLTLAL